MESLNSFNRLRKFNDHQLDDVQFRTRTRCRLIILSISLLLLLTLLVGILAGALIHKNNHKPSNATPSSSSSQSLITAVCSQTLYPSSCLSVLNTSNSLHQLKDLVLTSLMAARNSLVKVSAFPGKYANRSNNNPLVKQAMKVCDTVLNDAVLSLNDSIAAVAGGQVFSGIDNLRTWLSTGVTDQETCFDALKEAKVDFVDEIRDLAKNSTEFVSNSLAIVSKVVQNFQIRSRRRRLLETSAKEFPEWIAAAERRLLLEGNLKPKPNVTVAADGTGDVTTINAAVAMIPARSLSRFVVYVKAGKYVENVVLNSSCWNVMMYGDGKDSTIVTGEKNYVDGTLTYDSATFAVDGKGFIGKDIGFWNTAGPAKLQAVAVRSTSDLSVFFRCSFYAFQDTLFSHSNRQFYRDCDIAGTIDFIFGNAAVIFQNCNILPRQPMRGQFVTITAQGKTDPNQNTGISIQSCKVTALDGLTAAMYLGRPWKDYSTTVVMESEIGKFLAPAGWSAWEPGKDPPATIFYGEYRNTGLGAVMDGRVTWQGYKPVLTVEEVEKYGVRTFIQGGSWLPETRVAFNLS